jgi:biopolymer transport protein ExbB/TolQ
VILLVAIMMFGTLSAAAQPRQRMGDPEQRLERMMTHLTSVLILNEDQQVKVREILGEQIKKQQEIFEARRSEQKEQRQAMREEMEKWRADTDARMGEVLTDEQVEKYTKYMQDNRRGPRGERGGRNRGPRGRRG